jgi:hypothetical protein
MLLALNIMATAIPKYKRDIIRKDYFGERLPLLELSQRLGICRSTLVKQRMCLKALQKHYPDKLNDFDFTLLQATQFLLSILLKRL